MSYFGDILAGGSLALSFNTIGALGVPDTLNAGAVKVIRDGVDLGVVAGVALVANVVAGAHIVTVNTATTPASFTAGHDYNLYLSAGDVGGTSMVGWFCGSFSIQNRVLDNADASEIVGPADTPRKKLLQLWDRFLGNVVKDGGAGTIKMFKNDGVTLKTTQTFTSAGGVDTQNKAT